MWSRRSGENITLRQTPWEYAERFSEYLRERQYHEFRWRQDNSVVHRCHREPFVSDACGPHPGGGNCLILDRPFISTAGSILNSNLDTHRYAVDAGCFAADFCARFRGNRFPDWFALRSTAHREKCLPVCQHYAYDRYARNAIYQRALHRYSPFVEVSLGIVVGMILSAIWPERTAANLRSNASTLKIPPVS